jgi:tetratricopeptide (TPR) repeat protein
MESRERSPRVRAFLVGAAAISAALALVFISLKRHDRAGGGAPLYESACAARRAAETALQANRLDETEQACRNALAALDELALRSATERRHRRERAATLDALGQALARQGVIHEAVPIEKGAVDIWSNLVAEDQTALDDRWRLASGLKRLGLLFREAGRWDEAEFTFRRGRTLCEKLPNDLVADPRVARLRVDFLDQLGSLYLELERKGESLDCYNTAIVSQRALANASPGSGDDRERLIGLLMNQANVLTANGQLFDSERTLREALGHAERLIADQRSTARYRDLSATALNELASTIQTDRARRSETRALLEHALDVEVGQVGGRAQTHESLATAAATCDRLASLFREENLLDQAEGFYRKALGYHSRLSTERPDVAAIRFNHGRTLHNLAELLRARGRQSEALTFALQAVEQLGMVYSTHITAIANRRAYSNARWMLCTLLIDCKQASAAANAIEEYATIEPNGYEEALESARFLCRVIRTSTADSSVLKPQPYSMAQKYADQAMDALFAAVKNGYRDRDELTTAAVYEPIRDRDDFQRLLGEVKLRVEAVRRG